MDIKLFAKTVDFVRSLKRRLLMRRAELLTVLGFNFFGYSVFLTHYLLHNHGIRFPWVNNFEQLFAGRWFSPLFFWLGGSADIPAFSPLFAIVLNIASAVMVARLWDIPNRGPRYVLFLSIVTLFPAFTAALYFNYAGFMFSGSMFLAALALGVAGRPKIINIAGGAILAMLAMATNQPALSSLAVIFVGVCLAKIAQESNADTPVSKIFWFELAPRALAIVLGVIAYKVSLTVLSIGKSHATSTIELSEIPQRLIEVTKASVTTLTLSQPEFSSELRMVLLGIFLLGLATALFDIARWKCTFSAKTGRIVLVFSLAAAAVVATKAMYYVSPTNAFYEYRYNLAMAFFYAIPFMFLFKPYKSNGLLIVAIVLASFVTLRFVQADLLRQGVLMRAQMHDLAIANRVLSRIEQLDNLDFEQDYVLVKVGDYPKFRQNSFNSLGRKFDSIGSMHMDIGTISSNFAAASVMELLGSSVSFKFSKYNPNFMQDVKKAKEWIKQEGRKPWPHPTSVFAQDGLIVVYFHD